MEALQRENEALKAELQTLRQQLQQQQRAQADAFPQSEPSSSEQPSGQTPVVQSGPPASWASHGLSKEQVQRYSRQLLLPSFGLQAQQGVCSASVLIVGCGGLGSPAALYLAAAGIGKLGLVDHDSVETSNLHRQIIHTEARVGQHKALSAQAACEALNSSIQVQVHTQGFHASNALDIVRQYDVVIDCSDNPPTRYLVSDACVVAGKPLVSAAAVGTDGQLTVYHYGTDGPCYRCLFPEAPAPENCSRCADAGVLGIVPGIMGCLQALEAIKIVSGKGDVLSKRLMTFDALAGRFMTVKLRSRSPSCVACGDHPTISASSLPSYDYVCFTGQEAQDGPPTPLALLPEQDRLQPRQAKAVLEKASTSGRSALLLDVRPSLQFSLLQLPGAVNVPLEQLPGRMDEVMQLYSQRASGGGVHGEGGALENGRSAAAAGELSNVGSVSPQAHSSANEDQSPVPVVVICRRGNASQVAVQSLRQSGLVHAVDVVGGMTRWAAELDPDMPVL